MQLCKAYLTDYSNVCCTDGKHGSNILITLWPLCKSSVDNFSIGN